jgi:Uma2 family endonuclease
MGIAYEQFLTEFDGVWAEWVAGEVVEMTPVSLEHQDVTVFLVTVLQAFVSAHQAGKVLSEPFQMKTGPDLPGRSPDVFFLSRAHAERLRASHLEGPADLVVEVISPESRARDRGEKFYEYEQGGVEEYWLVDPTRRQVEFYARGEDGLFHMALAASEGVYRAGVLPGFWLEVAWLWRHPPLLEVLAAWGMVPGR